MKQVEGDEAVSTVKHVGEKPMLVAAYHPACPHCHTMVEAFKSLATEVKNHHSNLEVVAINMSKSQK